MERDICLCFFRIITLTSAKSAMLTMPNTIILCNVFRYISNSNIDNNFTIHNHAKFGYLSRDIMVRLIWTTRSSHYICSTVVRIESYIFNFHCKIYCLSLTVCVIYLNINFFLQRPIL